MSVTFPKPLPNDSTALVEPIRVAFVMHVMQVAGAEVLVAETIRRLAKRIDPVVFCLDAVGPLGEALRSNGTPVCVFNRRPGRDWGVAVRMGRELQARGVQVMHAHQYTPCFYSVLARLLAGGKPRVIFTEHGRHFPDAVGRARRWSNRLILSRLVSEANAVCDFSARALKSIDGFSGIPVGVIENGIDPLKYRRAADVAAARRGLGLPVARRYVVHVARFHPVKDQRTLLKAFHLVANSLPDVDLLLVGDGPLRVDLEQQVEALGLRERVRFLGVRSDVPAILGATEVFCLTSVSEAASLTLLEAMASALPVVVTDVGGNPEIVRGEVDGVLAPRGDAQAIGAALLRILTDESLAAQMGRAGAARVRDVYDLNRTIERHYESYRRAVSK
jgi:glycosyltransferase involved in cell wall biosynthesis